MEYIEYILYGLIQGFTEFIPVSSTAHLKIISLLLGIDDPGPSLSAIIQLGSVFAIFWYFRDYLFTFKISLSKSNFFTYHHKKLLISLLIGTIPIVLLGGFIKLFIPEFFDNILRSKLSIALISIFMALFMCFAEISKNKFVNIKNHKYKDSLLIGLVQAFSVVPGMSRSGVTISTALLSGWERRDAAKFSFMLGIPAISLAAIFQYIFTFNQYTRFNLIPLVVGILTSFFTSLFAIDFIIKYLSSRGLKLFILYRILFGILILLNL